jgi:non-specific serine/threonine protein kinase
VPMFPYSGSQPTASPTGYAQPAAPLAAMPTAGAMAGPMATGPQPSQIRRFSDSARAGDLPEWAREPERHPKVMMALWFALSAASFSRPGWLAIITALLTVVAGTVGRAQDARRWNRLQRGAASSADTSRMWAATPWYLLRSMLSVGFAFILALGAAAIILVVFQRSGIMEDSSPVFGSMYLLTRFVIFFLIEASTYLFILWMAPWGAATRRGGAHIINMIVPSDRGRKRMVVGLIVAGVVLLLMSLAGAMPNPSMAPFAGN